MANIQESVTEQNSSSQNDIEDQHVCDNCQSAFDANWKLERHKKNKNGCKKKLEDYKCTNCDKKYCNKYTLLRHLKKCVKDANINLKEHNEKTGTIEANSNNLMSDFLKNIGDDKNQLTALLVTVLSQQQSQINQFMEYLKNNPTVSNNHSTTSNITPISNINNGVINNVDTINQVINNNIIIPNFIYPFGYENINVLTDDEKLEILKDPNCVERVLGAIYSHNENKNFNRPNINREYVSVLNETLGVQSCNKNDFKDKFSGNGLMLIERIFNNVRPKLRFGDQLVILNNIEENRRMICMNGNITSLLSTIETCFNDPIGKTIFKKFTERLTLQDNFKPEKLAIVKNLIEELDKYNKARKKVTLNDNYLKNEVWTDMEDINFDTNVDSVRNDLDYYHIENTPRYKFYKNMEKDEHKFFDIHGISIGDIYEYRKIILQRSKDEIERIDKQYKNEALTSEITHKLLNKRSNDMNNMLKNVKFIDTSNMIENDDLDI
jgi:hypothetical protein